MSGADPTAMLVATLDPGIVLPYRALRRCRNLFAMTIRGTLGDDIGSLTELRIL